jgi:hypothetical protein
MMRWTQLGTGLLFSASFGCGARGGLDVDPGRDRPKSVRCGTDACSIAAGEVCLKCPSATGCVVPTPFDMRPDFWTNGLDCDPVPPDPHPSVPELGCDDDADCAPEEACLFGFDHTFCSTETETADTCRADLTFLCDGAGDCPPCATGCEPWPEFAGVSRCVYPGGP